MAAVLGLDLAVDCPDWKLIALGGVMAVLGGWLDLRRQQAEATLKQKKEQQKTTAVAEVERLRPSPEARDSSSALWSCSSRIGWVPDSHCLPAGRVQG